MLFFALDSILLELESKSECRRVGVPETVALNRREKFETLPLLKNSDREQVNGSIFI